MLRKVLKVVCDSLRGGNTWSFMLAAALVCPTAQAAEKLTYHPLKLDNRNKIIPWYTPASHAFDNYLDSCWAWALAAPNDSLGLPISFLYCAWNPGDPPTKSNGWENDVGEKIPNWVESARLYYQYSGNRAPLDYVKLFVDYSLDHGQTPPDHVWPSFPVGTSNAGDGDFRGFTQVFELWDCHVDLAADTGFALYRMYQLYGEARYRDKAIHVADLLAVKMTPGSASESPWPYIVNSKTGAVKSRYAASWDGALILFDLLIDHRQGDVKTYEKARAMLKKWLLAFPMKNGNWVDGHSDVKFDGVDNWSATCGSDMCLYLFDHPGWDPDFKKDALGLIRWTEDNFVNVATADSLPGQYYGAFIPAEQKAYMWRMGYQTARLGAQYVQWYAVSGDPVYKDRAYRCFGYNTYMMQASGQSSDGPTKEVGWWWSDCYGEAPRMYYYGMAAVPDWAPPDEDHLLHSSSPVTSIAYSDDGIEYATFDTTSIELFRLHRTPGTIFAGNTKLPRLKKLTKPGWTFEPASGVLRVRHDSPGGIRVQFGAENAR